MSAWPDDVEIEMTPTRAEVLARRAADHQLPPPPAPLTSPVDATGSPAERRPPFWYPVAAVVDYAATRGWTQRDLLDQLREASGTWNHRPPFVHYVTADRWAARLGLHPSLLWPTWFDDVAVVPPERWRQSECERRQKARAAKGPGSGPQRPGGRRKGIRAADTPSGPLIGPEGAV